MKYSLNKLYKAAGVSKQAVHNYMKSFDMFQEKLSGLVLEADILRDEHPGCGIEKMYHTLKPDFIGRDKFIEIFMELGFRIQKHKNFTRTTIPSHYKFPNLIEGSVINKSNRVWQSDITYFRVKDSFYYITFILDVYSRRIIGFEVSDNLRAEANIKALKMALKFRNDISLEGLVHHSDRGSQYIDKNYTKLLTQNSIQISMGAKAQDNAFAERINGIIKNEYLKYREIDSIKKLKAEVKKAVKHYNNKRIHSALKSSPADFEEKLVSLTDRKMSSMLIYSDGNKNIKSTFGQLNIDYSKSNFLCPILFNIN